MGNGEWGKESGFLVPTPHSPLPTPFLPFLPYLLPPWRRIDQHRRRKRGAKRRPPHQKPEVQAIARSG